MRNLFRDYIVSNGGNFYDLDEILAGRFRNSRVAKRCAEDLNELFTFMLVEFELADEWLWLFLPVTFDSPIALGNGRQTTSPAGMLPNLATIATIPSAEPMVRHRFQTDRVFYLHDPFTGRIDWLFESREGMQGPFASKALAEKALLDYIRACRHLKREPEPNLEPPDLLADAIRRRIAQT